MGKYFKGKTNYDKQPFIELPNSNDCWEGWSNICSAISSKISDITKKKKVIVVECYHGVNNKDALSNLRMHIGADFFESVSSMLPADAIDALVFPDVTDDEVFGYLTRLKLSQFFDNGKIEAIRKAIDAKNEGIILIYGIGASLICQNPDLLVYIDMARWEIQGRFRRDEISNLGVSNSSLKTSLQYKRAFFVDWRVLDRHKKKLMAKWDLIIDANDDQRPKMLTGKALSFGFKKAVEQPFRVVPFFDPGPWGGQWMREYFDLDAEEENFAWGFDCVPEENSLLFKVGDVFFETPSINVVFSRSKALLGNAVQARFGDEFPIRFDFLDTMDGGNLSLQVHPTTQYIQEEFGMHYTQDESYYMLDTGEGAHVYLGLKEDISIDKMEIDLKSAQKGEQSFPTEKYVEKWEVNKHDHILIPAGTIHCSGKDSMVLEISATPYIFTFKLWDWDRLGMDGLPRPINIEHGTAVLDVNRTPHNVKKELINNITAIDSGDGWREEGTGLHEREFIETRRHWFTKKVLHKTHGSVNVLNLVEGREAIVESPTNKFEPFVVHYAETFIIPENVKEYTIRPFGDSEGKECATLKAFVKIKP